MNRFANFKPVMRTARFTCNAGFASACVLLGAAACASSTEPKNGGEQPATLTALPRALTATEIKVRDAANDFSFALLGKVTAAEAAKNTFISPLSASFALGMTMNGAANQTYSEMNSALQLQGMTQAQANSGYKSLVALLLSLDPAVQLKIANSIWYRNSFTVRQPFLDSATKYFDASVKPLNFGDQVASLATINGWVKTATNDRITKVLDVIKDEDVMFLINAIYFKGSWRNQFDPARTTTDAFTPAFGASQSARLMRRSDKMSYTETAQYQAVDLPYGNTAFSMTVLLPKPGTDVNALASGFNTASWTTLTSQLHEAHVTLALPKLRLEYERELTPDLKAMGMVVPFLDHVADFSHMTPEPAFISFVKQNSFVDVNEEGTEAAAVTTVGIGVTSAPVSVTMTVNRPYLFVIRERLSGTVLFMGKIVRMPG